MLALNKAFRPVAVINGKTALTLLYKDKAHVVDPHYNIYTFDKWVSATAEIEKTHQDTYKRVGTPNFQFLMPYVIRLLDYDSVPVKWSLKFSRYHILIRDNYMCQYCRIPLSRSDLTIDHVIPKSRGGKTTWENCVASCRDCNREKDNKLPEEAGMQLIHGAPKKLEYDLGSMIRYRKMPQWENFI